MKGNQKAKWLRLGALIALLSLPAVDIELLAKEERSWDGAIHFVDAKMIIDFHGYDRGTWKNLRDLRIYSHKSDTAGPKVTFRLVADPGKPLQATYQGKIRVEVDGMSATVQEIRFVRDAKHASWRIDQAFIERLKSSVDQSSDHVEGK